MYMGIEIPRLYTKEKKKGIEIQNRVKVEFLTEYYIWFLPLELFLFVGEGTGKQLGLQWIQWELWDRQ